MVAFHCYDPSDDESGGFHRWLGEQPPEFRAEIDATLLLLQRDRTLDESGLFKNLRGRLRGLTEIKIDFEIGEGKAREKVHIRLLGFGSADAFVLLNGFRKFGGSDYGPAGAAALRRKNGVENDGRRAQPCRFPAPNRPSAESPR